MAGIAGYLKIGNTGINLSESQKELFFNPIKSQKTIFSKYTISVNSFIGLSDFVTKPNISIDSEISIFILGDLFINDKPFLKQSEKYKILKNLWKENTTKISSFIHGNFILVIIDNNRNEYLIINSHAGMIPLYYSIQNNTLIFSTRLESFIKADVCKLEVNKSSLTHFLMFGYDLGNSSFIKNINVLPAGSFILGSEKWEMSQYDDFQWLLNSPQINYKAGTELIDHLFEKSIKKIVQDKSDIGLSITGGWDGRLILSYLKSIHKDPKILYTYGKENHIDMITAQKFSSNFSYHHIPIFLNGDFVDEYNPLANETILLSDGLRAYNRGHYTLMAQKLSKQVQFILSGNCGSNILKIVQAPGAVYSNNLFKVFLSKTDNDLINIYKEFLENHPWINNSISEEEFLYSIKNTDLIFDNNIDTAKRFYHFLITNVERKYFGVEAASYSNYINNQTPFMDIEFLKGVVKTPFFGGHYKFLEKNTSVRYRLSLLYADLMIKRNKDFAKFTSDRGFPITWFKNPLGRVSGFVVKKYMSKWGYVKDSDPYSHNAGLKTIIRKWNVNNNYFISESNTTHNDVFARALSWSRWYDLLLAKKR